MGGLDGYWRGCNFDSASVTLGVAGREGIQGLDFCSLSGLLVSSLGILFARGIAEVWVMQIQQLDGIEHRRQKYPTSQSHLPPTCFVRGTQHPAMSVCMEISADDE